MKIDEEKNCTNCLNNSNKGTCIRLGIVPMSIDGKGIKNCKHHESIGRKN